MRIGSFLLILAIGFSLQLRASDETNREVIQTFVNYHIGQGEFNEAERKLLDHLDGDEKDSERWNLLGLVRVEQKKFKDADNAFYKAYETAPEDQKGSYAYNHATVMLKLKRQADAEALFKKAALDPKVKDSAKYALQALKEGKEPPPLKLVFPGIWSFGTNVIVGYDTNVQLIAINTLDSINRTDTASYMTTPSLRGTYKKEFYNGLLDGGMNLSYSHYFNSETSKFNAAVAAANGRWRPGVPLGPMSWGVNANANVVFLNTDGMQFFNWNQGFGLEGEIAHSAKAKTVLELPLRLQRFNDTGNADNFRTGFAAGLKANHRRTVKSNQFSFGLELERIWTYGVNFKSYQYTVPLTLAHLFGGGWIGMASLRAGQVFYTESQTGRQDINVNPSLILSKFISSSLNANLTLAYTRNHSNVDTAAYQKYNVFLGGSYEF